MANFFQKIMSQFQTPPIDPAKFNDPVAMKAEWTPLKGGGANFRTHKLVQAGSNSLEFRPTAMTRVFYSLFILVGVGSAVPIFVTPELFLADFPRNPPFYFMAFFALAFGCIGVLIFVFLAKKRVFDKSYGLYYKGRTSADVPMDPSQVKGSLRLGDIHALQIISEWVSGKNSNYKSYELNLVLNGGERVNVVDHGNLEKLREDAQVLAQFLGVPVWDATLEA